MLAETLFGPAEDQQDDNENQLNSRSERIEELNDDYSEEEKQAALDWTNSFIQGIKQ